MTLKICTSIGKKNLITLTVLGSKHMKKYTFISFFITINKNDYKPPNAMISLRSHHHVEISNIFF